MSFFTFHKDVPYRSLKSTLPYSVHLVHVSPGLRQIVRRFMLVQFLVKPVDVPPANEATNDAQASAGDDEAAAILVPWLLRGQL